MTTKDESNVHIPTAYNSTTLEVLWGMAIILKYDPFAKIAATQNTIHFGVYYTRSLMTEDEQINMDSWGWEDKGGSYVRKV